MNKPASLRAALEAALPELAANPDRLLMFIEKGGIAARAGSLSFAYHYTVTVIITDFTDHPDSVIIPLLAWIADNEPPLLQNPQHMADGFQFEAEIINHNAIDLQFTLKLTERVGVKKNADGSITATHFGEPPLDPYQSWQTFQIYVKNELVYDSEQSATGA